MPPQHPMMTTADAANYLRVSPSMLVKMRQRGDGPPYVKVGRKVFYQVIALAHWLSAQTVS